MMIVVAVSQMLELPEYSVTAKTSSTNALETFQIQPDIFDLIILDMVMPEIMGDELAKTMREIRPDIPIILCTGYNKKLNAEKAKSIGVKTLIMKPIEYNELAKAVRSVLDKD